jgi:uncharacterized protein YjbJ (UPF0337 family)
MINENVIKGQWKEIKGEIQKKWGQLTNDDLDQVHGDMTALEGLMQKKLGFKQDQARTELNGFLERWSKDVPKSGSDFSSPKDTNF